MPHIAFIECSKSEAGKKKFGISGRFKLVLVHSVKDITKMIGWLVGWGLTALLTQNRSYRACRFVGIFYSKL